jgi:hypothetical protein
MRRLAVWVIDGLPFDPRSRRVLDETLLDWAHEQLTTTTTGRRAAVEARGVASLVRAAFRSVLGDVVRTPWAPLVGRLALAVGLPALLLTFLAYALMWPELRAVAGLSSAIELSALQAVHDVELLIPVLVFLAWAWPGRGAGRPTVGTALVVLLGTLLFTLLLEPSANSRYLEIARSLSPLTPTSSSASPGGRAFLDLYWAVRWSPGAVVFGAVAFKIGLACLAAGLALLAASIRSGRLALERGWLALAPLIYLGVFKLASTSYVSDYFLPETIAGSLGRMLVVALAVLWFARAAWSRPWLLLIPGNLALLWLVVLPDDRLLLYRVFVSGPLPALLALMTTTWAVTVRPVSTPVSATPKVKT